MIISWTKLSTEDRSEKIPKISKACVPNKTGAKENTMETPAVAMSTRLQIKEKIVSRITCLSFILSSCE